MYKLEHTFYRLSPTAEHDLENIWLYTCRQWSEEQANHYIDMLTCCLCRTGSRLNDCYGLRSYPPRLSRYNAGRHMIYFRVTSYGIILIPILHGRIEAMRPVISYSFIFLHTQPVHSGF